MRCKHRAAGRLRGLTLGAVLLLFHSCFESLKHPELLKQKDRLHLTLEVQQRARVSLCPQTATEG